MAWKDRETRKEYNREWHKENKERIREYNQRYYKRHTEKYLEIRRKYKREHPWGNHYSYAKNRCTNPNHSSYKHYGAKGIRFLLTMLEVELLYKRDDARGMNKPSIDRINPRGDYHFGNCRFIELSDNARRQGENK